MNIFRFFYFLIVIYFFTACNGKRSAEQDEEKEKKDSASIAASLKGTDAEPNIKKTDSLQILYYDDPDDDSLRYTRFYHYISVNDTAIIRSVIKNIDTTYTISETVNRQCRSEGKIILYSREDPVKTLYFSTRCPGNCCYVYFIKNGIFYYFPLMNELSDILIDQKVKSIKP